MKTIEELNNKIITLTNQINNTIDNLIKVNLEGQLSVYKEWLKDLDLKYKVNIIESEKGYGSKIDQIMYFRTKEEAEEFVKNFNSKNNKKETPDWYMMAEYMGFKK